MKKICVVLVLASFFTLVASCGSTQETVDIPDITDVEREAFSQIEGDTISIANEETEYEIIIIEPGFSLFINSIARPREYYSQSYLENKNVILFGNFPLVIPDYLMNEDERKVMYVGCTRAINTLHIFN
jgi:hypothetical protein